MEGNEKQCGVNEKQSVVLVNGVRNAFEMPLIGFGTYKLHKKKVVAPTKAALACGYALVDTASVYQVCFLCCSSLSTRNRMRVMWDAFWKNGVETWS